MTLHNTFRKTFSTSLAGIVMVLYYRSSYTTSQVSFWGGGDWVYCLVVFFC